MRSPCPPASAPRGGFTLLEVVLAMSILLIGMTTILGLLSFGAALANAAEQRTSAAMVVEAVIADLEEGMFPLELQDGVEVVGDPVPIRDRSLPGRPGLRYSATPTLAPRSAEEEADGAPLEYKVEVDISWTSSGVRRSTTFFTLLPRQVPFGERLRRRFVERGTGAPSVVNDGIGTVAPERDREP